MCLFFILFFFYQWRLDGLFCCGRVNQAVKMTPSLATKKTKNKNKTRSSLSVIFQPGREENREVRWRRCTAAFIEGSGSWEAQQEPRLLPFLSCGRVGVIISTQGMLVVSFNNVFTADRVSHYHRTSIFFSSSSSSQEYRFVDTHCKKKKPIYF